MGNCNLCQNKCNINRSKNLGRCGISSTVKIARSALHFFEEPPISGKSGSGTIFFCGCGLQCVYCQNYEVSRNLTGTNISAHDLANEYKKLEDLGAHNINLVNPTHYADNIIESLNIYKPKIPIVYNTHGYDSIDTIKKLSNFIDIYLPDLKYISQKTAARYSNCPGYFEATSVNILEMVKQKPLKFFKNGLLKSGVIVRHLILPMNISETVNILDWLSANIGTLALVSLMSQYTPFGKIENFPELKRKITKSEYNRAKDKMQSSNLTGFIQELSSANDAYIPQWDYKL